jgi:thioredoxin reductase (NADPH)
MSASPTLSAETGSSAPSRPVFLLLGGEASGLSALADVMEGRYGPDYRILAEISAAAALRQLEELRAAGGEVALLMADQWMPETSGVEFLTRAHDLHPGAKRALLVDGMDPVDLPSVLQATTLGRIDLHLHKPWSPPDDRLHPAVTELLAEWTRSQRPRLEMVKIVANQWDSRSQELRDLLERNNITYGFYAADAQAAQALLSDLGGGGERLPVVVIPGGKSLVQPSNVELASAFGLRTQASPELCDVAIIGAGPAGLAAAVYAASEGLHTVLVEREAMGGQAGTSSMIRNYLGFPRGVSGVELAQRARSQAWHFGAEFIYVQEATGLRAERDERIVLLSGGSELRARVVMLSTGVWYRRIGVSSVDRLLGAGVFYGSAAGAAKALEGERVYVVGGGNSAGQAAVHLARHVERVSLLVRGDSLTATMSTYLIDEIGRAWNIDVWLNTEVAEARGERRIEGLMLRNVKTGALAEVPAVAVFIMIGTAPQTDWLEGVVQRDPRGFILTGGDLKADSGGAVQWPLARPPYPFETSLPGVFAAGDVRHRSIKRVASAVGEGSVAVSSLHEYLGSL